MFRYNNIHYVSEDFFVGFYDLKQVLLAHNQIKWISKLCFASAKIDVISLAFNKLTDIETMEFYSSETMFINEINLDSNHLGSFPMINNYAISVNLFSMTNQTVYGTGNKSNISNRLNIKSIDLLNLSNSDIENTTFDLKGIEYLVEVDLSSSRVDINRLCDMFFNLGRTFTLRFFPQKWPFSYNCRDLNSVKFSFGRNRVKLEGCELKKVEQNESYCLNRRSVDFGKNMITTEYSRYQNTLSTDSNFHQFRTNNFIVLICVLTLLGFLLFGFIRLINIFERSYCTKAIDNNFNSIVFVVIVSGTFMFLFLLIAIIAMFIRNS